MEQDRIEAGRARTLWVLNGHVFQTLDTFRLFGLSRVAAGAGSCSRQNSTIYRDDINYYIKYFNTCM